MDAVVDISAASTQHSNQKPTSSDASTSSTEEVLTIHDVSAWLDKLGLSQYGQPFLDNHVDGLLLRSLSPTELRDDLTIISLRHRRVIMRAIAALPVPQKALSFEAASHIPEPAAPPHSDKMPEHGRILDHLSNVRTYHSWLRVSVQFLAFSVITLRLAPEFRHTRLIAAAASYFAAVAILAMIYAVYRYGRVVVMIEQTRVTAPTYTSDAVGTYSIVLLIVCAAVFAVVIIALPAPSSPVATP